MTVQAAPAEGFPALITPMGGVRCWFCGRKIANQISPPYDLECQRVDHGVKCGARNIDDTSGIIAYSQ